MFVAALCRPPTPDEMNRAVKHIHDEKEATTAYADLLWVLVNTKEFLYVR